MLYSLTILNDCTVVFLVSLLVHTRRNHEGLSQEHGREIAAMPGC